MNIYELIKKNNEHNASKQAMSITTDNGEIRTYTYKQMFEEVNIFSDKLKSAGIQNGDRIIIIAENSPEWHIAYLSIMAVNCTAVLVDAALPREEILRLIDNSYASCILMSPKIKTKLVGIISKTIPVLNMFNQALPFEGHLSSISDLEIISSDGDKDIALIIYSSGTTKTATGIMHTHDALIGTTEATIKCNKLEPSERFLVVIPNSHIYGMITSVIGPLLLGASIHFIESMTGENVLKAFNDFKPTIFSCVPRVFEMFKKQIIDKINSNKFQGTVFKRFLPICIKLRETTGINLGKVIFKAIHKGFGGHVRIFCAAGAPLDLDTALFYYGTGFNLFLTYGLTETNIPIIGNRFDNYTPYSCGQVYPHAQIKLENKDESGHGEIYVKTPYIMKGYFRDEEATNNAFEDGWFKTGDIGSIDSNGNISITGRCKDNIVLSTGKKVTPDDIESSYVDIHGVKELVVCGVPSVEGGYDEVHAFVVRNELALDIETIQQSIHEKGSTLSQYMKIAKVHIVDEILKTSLQKPKRYLLKKIALENKEIIVEKNQLESDHKEVNVQASILKMINKIQKNKNEYSYNTRVIEELGFDSLNIIELNLMIEKQLGKNISNYFKPNVTIKDLVEAIENTHIKSINLVDEAKFPLEKRWSDYIVFRFFCGLIRLLYKVNMRGLDNLPKNSGFILCPNHESNFDALWVVQNFNRQQFNKLCIVAKRELHNNSGASKLLSRISGMIPINRNTHDTLAMARCQEKLMEGYGVLIFPEGTRTKNGKIGEFKKGAAMLALNVNVPIIPVKIKGAYNIYPLGSKLPKLFDFKNMRRHSIDIIFGSPLYPTNLEVNSLNTKLQETVIGL